MNIDKKLQFDHTKEEIRTRINIADIIGRHVALKASGQSLKGLCPFHKEKSPSFIVTPAKGIFYCFGCHKGGDVFTFLMEHDGLSFSEALHLLADEAGVRLDSSRGSGGADYEDAQFYGPETEAASGQTQYIPKNEMIKIHEMAVDFYYRQTRNHPRVIEYFLGRGLTREIIREFRLGFAPPGWTELLAHAKLRGVTAEALVQCGLAISKPGNKLYDRFRDRIMFPIFDTSGRPIGFGGRGLTKDAEPKYLNSPETLLYQKNKVFYGLHAAQSFIKQAKSIIIVEGYMDFLALYQAGVKNAVATSGTALTDVQARILRRFTSVVYLVFDGDGAGINAAQRAIFVLGPYNLDVRVLILPDDEDPDSFVKKYGKDAFLDLLSRAKTFSSFIIEKTIADKGIESPQKKSAALDFLAPLIQSTTDSIVRQDLIKQISERLHVDENIIVSRIKKQTAALPRSEASALSTADYSATIEGNFIRMLLSNPESIKEARQYITPETFTDQFSTDLYSIILHCFDEAPNLGTLIGSIADPEMKRVVSRLFAQGEYEGALSEDLRHSMLRLQRKFLKNRIRQTQFTLKSQPHDKAALMEQVKQDSTQLKELETYS
jgi:DNA primase